METAMEPESRASVLKRRKRVFWRVTKEFFFAGLFAVAIVMAAKFDDQSASLSAKLGLASLPILALTLWWWASARWLLSLEEFERSLAVNSLAIAFGITLWLVTSYGLVALFTGLPELPAVFIAPLSALVWQAIWLILSVRYS